MVKLEQRNNGGWVLTAKLAATGQRCEGPFEVRETSHGFELWFFDGPDSDEMIMHENGLTRDEIEATATAMLPEEWTA